jgi:hypothetical protein
MSLSEAENTQALGPASSVSGFTGLHRSYLIVLSVHQL